MQTAQYFVLGKVGDWAVGTSAGWVGVGSWLAAASFALTVASQFPAHHFGKRSYIHLSGLREFLSVGSDKELPGCTFLLGGFRSRFIWPIGKGVAMICLHLRYSIIFLQSDEKGLPWFQKAALYYLSVSVLFMYIHMYPPIRCGPLDPCL